MKKKIEEYFSTPKTFFKDVVRIIDYLKFNRDVKSINVPVFNYGEIKFTKDFDDLSPTTTMEGFKLDNPYFYSIMDHNYADWWIFKEILKKFEEKQKDLNKEED